MTCSVQAESPRLPTVRFAALALMTVVMAKMSVSLVTLLTADVTGVRGEAGMGLTGSTS